MIDGHQHLPPANVLALTPLFCLLYRVARQLAFYANPLVERLSIVGARRAMGRIALRT